MSQVSGPDQQGRLLGRGFRVAVCVLGVALVPILSLILWSVCVSLPGLSPFLSFCCWPFRIWPVLTQSREGFSSSLQGSGRVSLRSPKSPRLWTGPSRAPGPAQAFGRKGGRWPACPAFPPTHVQRCDPGRGLKFIQVQLVFSLTLTEAEARA